MPFAVMGEENCERFLNDMFAAMKQAGAKNPNDLPPEVKAKIATDANALSMPLADEDVLPLSRKERKKLQKAKRRAQQ